MSVVYPQYFVVLHIQGIAIGLLAYGFLFSKRRKQESRERSIAGSDCRLSAIPSATTVGLRFPDLITNRQKLSLMCDMPASKCYRKVRLKLLKID